MEIQLFLISIKIKVVMDLDFLTVLLNDSHLFEECVYFKLR